MSAPRALLLIWQLLTGLTAGSVARASEPPRLTLAVSSQCPSRELVASELAPLLGDRALEMPTSANIAITDAGESYRIRVGTAEREVNDPRRDCQERAKVSAVFIALNLPNRAPAPPPQPLHRPSQQLETTGAHPTQTQLVLRLLGAVEHAPELSSAGKGLYVGASLRRGRVDATLESGVFAPLSMVAADREAVTYELWRFPTSLTLGFSTKGSALSLGVAGGLALDVLRFRGVDLPNPDSGVRINPGLVLTLPLRLHANRHVAAVLRPTLTLFPRTYIVRLEPTRDLGESPRFWLGAHLGLETSVLGG